MESIASRIREAMNIRGMKQSDLVAMTGIGKSSISTYLSGDYEPKQKNLYKIAKALNVNEAWLMGEDVPMNREVKRQPSMYTPVPVQTPPYYRSKGTEMTCFALNAYLTMRSFQSPEDVNDGMVTIRGNTTKNSFRVPESIMADQDDTAAHLIEIIGYMPESTEEETRYKLRTLLGLLNENGIEKALAYVEGLANNPKYHAELSLDDIGK